MNEAQMERLVKAFEKIANSLEMFECCVDQDGYFRIRDLNISELPDAVYEIANAINKE